jgi:hypothetical protein
MKKIALALAAAAALAAPVVMTVGSAGAAPDNSTINCNNFGDSNRCTATDPDYINYIRVFDRDTGLLVKDVQVACSDQVTRKGFNFPDTGTDRYEIRIGDCNGAVDTYKVTIPQAV